MHLYRFLLSGMAAAVCLLNHASAQDSVLPVAAERAFPNLDFNRPIVVTHAADGSNRVFVAEQEGIIKVFPNNQE
ncbi:MAG: Quinoprotein glucose dehydrogenase precursor [Planctomycetota bacterium]